MRHSFALDHSLYRQCSRVHRIRRCERRIFNACIRWMRELKAFVYLHASLSRSWMAVPDSKYILQSTKGSSIWDRGSWRRGKQFSPACTPAQHSGEAIDTQFVDKQVYGHSLVLSAKTEPMNKHFLPQIRIGVVVIPSGNMQIESSSFKQGNW